MRGRREALAAGCLLALAWWAILEVPPLDAEWLTDVPRYADWAAAFLEGRLPYRDVPFEYPPLAAPLLLLPGLLATDEAGYRLAFAALALLLAGALALLAGRLAAMTGGSRRRALLVAAGAPLLTGAVLRTHFDLAPVVLTTASLLALLKGRPGFGFAVLGVATMTKGFPLLAAPVALAWLWGDGDRRGAARGTLALVAVVAVVGGLSLILSTEGALAAVRYHLERPVQVESTVAMLVRLADAVGWSSAAVVVSHGSDGLVHPAAGLLTAVLAGLATGALALLSLAAHDARGAPRALALGAFAALVVGAAFGKVLSPQFVVWTLPLLALAWAWRERALGLSLAAAAALTLAEFPHMYLGVVAGEPAALALVAARDAALVLAAWLAIRSLVRLERSGGPERARTEQHPATVGAAALADAGDRHIRAIRVP